MMIEHDWQKRMKHNQLIALIREVGKYHREDPVFLEDYAKEQAEAWNHDLDSAIECFQNLKNEAISECSKKGWYYKDRLADKKDIEPGKGRLNRNLGGNS